MLELPIQSTKLSRTLVSARVIVGPDGIKRTELVTSGAADRVQSNPTLFDGDDLRGQLVDLVLGSPAVPARMDQRAAVAPLMEAFFEGLGDQAVPLLSANLGRAGARLVRLVAEEQRAYMAAPTYDRVVELKVFAPTRATDRSVSSDRHGEFSRTVAYDGWKRALFPIEWFDSRTERTVANIVDADQGVSCWVRLHVRELPILWNSAGQEYNPDLIAIDADRTHWVIEVKMDKEMGSTDVKGKREAARRWAIECKTGTEVGLHQIPEGRTESADQWAEGISIPRGRLPAPQVRGLLVAETTHLEPRLSEIVSAKASWLRVEDGFRVDPNHLPDNRIGPTVADLPKRPWPRSFVPFSHDTSSPEDLERVIAAIGPLILQAAYRGQVFDEAETLARKTHEVVWHVSDKNRHTSWTGAVAKALELLVAGKLREYAAYDKTLKRIRLIGVREGIGADARTMAALKKAITEGHRRLQRRGKRVATSAPSALQITLFQDDELS